MKKITIEPFKVIGIGVRTTNEDGKAATEIAALWGRFLNEHVADAIPNKTDPTIYSLYTDYEADHTKPYTAMLCCKVNDLTVIPEGMIGKSIEGGKYLKITAKGDLTQGLILSQWAKIWEMDIERIYTADFEVFGEKAQNPMDAEIDFLIAVK